MYYPSSIVHLLPPAICQAHDLANLVGKQDKTEDGDRDEDAGKDDGQGQDQGPGPDEDRSGSKEGQVDTLGEDGIELVDVTENPMSKTAIRDPDLSSSPGAKPSPGLTTRSLRSSPSPEPHQAMGPEAHHFALATELDDNLSKCFYFSTHAMVPFS